MGAYDEDMSIPAAKVAELETANTGLAETVQTLKAQNFDLLRSGSGGGDGNSHGGSGGNPNGNDENTVVTINDLFD